MSASPTSTPPEQATEAPPPWDGTFSLRGFLGWSLWDQALVLGSLAAALYFLGHLTGFEFGRDQGIYAQVADQMVNGEPPYRDSWDFKPPGIFFVYGISHIFGRSMHAIRFLEAIGFGSLLFAFPILSERFVGDARGGYIGAALAILTHVQLEFWHTGQPESFGAILLTWALVLATAPLAHRPNWQRASWMLVGALYTMAALLKPPLGGGFLVSLGFALGSRFRNHKAWSKRLAPILFYSLGALVPLLLTAGYFWAKGALWHLYHTLFIFTPGYTKINFSWDKLGGNVYYAAEKALLNFSPFNLLGMVFLLRYRDTGEERNRETAGIWHVALVVAFCVFGVGLQGKFFPYHFGAALPLLAILAGWGYWKLWRGLKPSWITPAVFMLGVYLLYDVRTAQRHLYHGFWKRCDMRIKALRNPKDRQRLMDDLHGVADVSARANRQVSEWLVANTKPEHTVYIWGFEPVIYYTSQRKPASRFIYNVPQRATWAKGWGQSELLKDLAKTKPHVIIVAHNDVFGMVTGNNLDSKHALKGFAPFKGRLEKEYHYVKRIEDFEIWVENP